MKAEQKTNFAKDPAKAVERAIARFVEESVSNRRKVDGGKYFDAPLVGYASANDPLFKHYKKLIGKFHFTPREMFELTYGKIGNNSELSVISYVLPISEDTRKANRKEDRFQRPGMGARSLHSRHRCHDFRYRSEVRHDGFYGISR